MCLHCVHIYFTDKKWDDLMRAAQARQRSINASGTVKNHKYNVKQYLIFCFHNKVDPLAPNLQQVAVWMEVLLNKQLSPDTIANKISSVRRYISLSQGDISGVNHIRIKNLIESIKKSREYTSRAKKPIPAQGIHIIVNSISENIKGIIFKSAVLLLLWGGYRQSDISSMYQRSFDPRYDMTRTDMELHKDHMVITLKWSKNIRKFGQENSKVIMSASDKNICPVSAMKTMCSLIPTKKLSDPLFMFPDRSPVPVTYLRAQWKKLLKDNNLDSKTYSLHSLRKTAATLTVEQGLDSVHVTRFIGWNSTQAKFHYIQNNSQKWANRALDQALSV